MAAPRRAALAKPLRLRNVFLSCGDRGSAQSVAYPRGHTGWLGQASCVEQAGCVESASCVEQAGCVEQVNRIEPTNGSGQPTGHVQQPSQFGQQPAKLGCQSGDLGYQPVPLQTPIDRGPSPGSRPAGHPARVCAGPVGEGRSLQRHPHHRADLGARDLAGPQQTTRPPPDRGPVGGLCWQLAGGQPVLGMVQAPSHLAPAGGIGGLAPGLGRPAQPLAASRGFLSDLAAGDCRYRWGDRAHRGDGALARGAECPPP